MGFVSKSGVRESVKKSGAGAAFPDYVTQKAALADDILANSWTSLLAFLTSESILSIKIPDFGMSIERALAREICNIPLGTKW